jgi:hypothetical protein
MRAPRVSIVLLALAALGALALAHSRPAVADPPRSVISVQAAGPACSDLNHPSPDAGTDWCVSLSPLATLRVQAGVGSSPANLYYRTSYLPDAGALATTSDKGLQGGSVEAFTLNPSNTLPDAGAIICLHLDAADPSAGVTTCP